MKRTPAIFGILIAIAAIGTAGCGRDSDGVRSAMAAAAESERYETLVIPYGTIVVASLDSRISTATSHSGDPFAATTIRPIIVDGRIAVAAGARIHGVLRDVQASGRIKGRARLTLIYQGMIDLKNENHAIRAEPLTLRVAAAGGGDNVDIVAGRRLNVLMTSPTSVQVLIAGR